jgi:hypothetical protein
MKIYEQLKKIIQEVIKNTRFPKIESEEGRHYYFEGLKIAKQIIENEEGFVYEDYAYEKLEEFIESLLVEGALTPEEIEEITQNIISKYYED